MGKYIEQAGSYSQGIRMLKAGLEETVQELEKVKSELLVNTADNKDMLSYYVNEFNKNILEEIKNLIPKCTINTSLLFAKAKEIDDRLLLESQNAIISENSETNSLNEPTIKKHEVNRLTGLFK